MLGLEMLLKSLGITPDILMKTQQVFVDIANNVQLIQLQLDRIEVNTLDILMAIDPIATPPTGPLERLDVLPRMQGEVNGTAAH